MATNSEINGAEPSTVTFKLATVTQDWNSTIRHQELLTLAGAESTLEIVRVLGAAPASTDMGLVVRQVGYVAPSTTVSVAAMPAGSSGVTVNAFAASLISSAAAAGNSSALLVRVVGGASSGADFPVTLPANSSQVEVRALPANSSQVEVRALPAGMLSTAAPASNDTGLTVRQVGYSTIVSVAAMPANSSLVQLAAISAGLLSSNAPAANSSGLIVRPALDARVTAASTSAFATSTQFTISGSTVLTKYITAYSITSTDLTATVLRFMGGSTMVWPVRLQATSSAITGANMAGGAGYLFKIDAASSATLQISGSSRAGWTVGISYYLAP